MFEDFILQVVLNMPRHHNQCLSHEIQKQPAKQGHQQNEAGIDQYSERKNLKEILLEIETFKCLICSDIIDNQIDGKANELRGNDLKDV